MRTIISFYSDGKINFASVKETKEMKLFQIPFALNLAWVTSGIIMEYTRIFFEIGAH